MKFYKIKSRGEVPERYRGKSYSENEIKILDTGIRILLDDTRIESWLYDCFEGDNNKSVEHLVNKLTEAEDAIINCIATIKEESTNVPDSLARYIIKHSLIEFEFGGDNE